MKRNDKHTEKKKNAIGSGLTALCIAVLAGIYFLTMEPGTDFTPAFKERVIEIDR